MSETIYKTEAFSLVHCSECGASFCLADDFIKRRRSDRKTFFCPNGHSQWYPGETDSTKAQRLAGELDMERTRRRETEKQLDYARRTQKATSTRLKKVNQRVAHGVCPCCTRSFQNLARHMETKHPAFGKETGND